MYNFYVLDGKKLIDYKPKREHYARALERITDANGSYDLERLWQERPDQFKQILYLSIKFIEHVFDNSSDCSQEETQSWFFIVEFINQMIAKITPRQFMEIFPIAKDYDGEKYGCKDYFYTKDYMAHLGYDAPIGEEKASEFLLEYWNPHIEIYAVHWMEIINKMHRLNGGRDIFVEFMEEQGLSFPTYHKEGNYLVNSKTGERHKVQKPKRRLRKLFSVVSNK